MEIWGHNISPLVCISTAGIWVVPGNLHFIIFSVEIKTQEKLGLDANGSTAYISVCLTMWTHIYLTEDRCNSSIHSKHWMNMQADHFVTFLKLKNFKVSQWWLWGVQSSVIMQCNPLKMEVTFPSKSSAYFQRTTWHYPRR